MTERITVAVRVRPQNELERSEGQLECVQIAGNQLSLGKRSFRFDHVLGKAATNEHIFETLVSPLLPDVLSGFNVTIMAYGQTGSGKTFTMMPVIAKATQHIFSTAAEGVQFSLSIAEIYNEKVHDLQDLDSQVVLREDADKGVVATGLSLLDMPTYEDVCSAIEGATQRRATAPTLLNQASSRSHALITLYVQTASVRSSITFVDLAGSERMKKAHGVSATGQRVKELVSINKGLLALGNVIVALRTQSRHTPFRSSPLTRLLQQALSGNSRTLMIACVSGSDQTFEESLNTLKYAYRAKELKVSPMVNSALAEGSHGADPNRHEDYRLRIAEVEADLQAEKRLTSQLEGDLFRSECATLEEKERREELERMLKDTGCMVQDEKAHQALAVLETERDLLVRQRLEVEEELKRLSKVEDSKATLSELETKIFEKEEAVLQLKRREKQQEEQLGLMEQKLADLMTEKQRLTADLLASERRLEQTQMEKEARGQQKAQLQKSYEARLRAADASINQYKRKVKELAGPIKKLLTSGGEQEVAAAQSELTKLKEQYDEAKGPSQQPGGGLQSRMMQLQQTNKELVSKLKKKEEAIQGMSLAKATPVRETKRRSELAKVEEIENELEQAWQDRERVRVDLDQLRRGTDLKRRKKALDGWTFRLKGLQQQLNDPNATEEQKQFAAGEAEIATKKIQGLHRSFPEVNTKAEELEEEYHLIDDRVDSLTEAKDFHMKRIKALSEGGRGESQGQALDQSNTELARVHGELSNAQDLVAQQQIQISELARALAEKEALLERILRGK